MTVSDPGSSSLLLRRAGIDTYQQPVVFMHRDCAVCRAEGFAALTRIEVRVGDRSLVATLNVVVDDWLPTHEAALSEAAWNRLRPQPGERARFAHPEPARSAGALRRKVFG
ncbi:MAG: thymidine phosphorylase, partial [Xanthomonadales bacterium]|nr:thymidine phosphorylase [Xanthomonadales bacterium]